MKQRSEPSDFSHSLTDLMAGVAAIFLLIAVVFILMAAKREERESRERQRFEDQIEDLQRFRKSVLVSLDSLGTAIESDLSLAAFVTIDKEARKNDPFLFVVVFNRQRLSFNPGVCALAPSQDEIVAQAAPRVLAHVCLFADEMRKSATERKRASISMTLEGHTDRHAFLPRRTGCGVDSGDCLPDDTSARCERVGFENNVRLSAARAQNVFFSMQRAVETDASISDCLERYFVVAGRGPVEPADGHGAWRLKRPEGDEDKNRRVILKIRAQPAIEGLSTAQSTVEPSDAP